MNHFFTAEDGTEMTFEMVKEIFGCQQFKVMVEGQADRSMIFVGPDTKSHCKTLEILLAWGMIHFERLDLWKAILLNERLQPKL